jgi:KDO2-lipid IV(A) lauroyltransferase
MVKIWVFRLASVLLPLIPLRIAWPIADELGALIWAAAPGPRRRVERNLRHVPSLMYDPVRLHRATRGVFRTMALNYLDFFRGPRLSDAELYGGWTIVNQDLFDAAMAQGKGLILLSGHFGNFEYSVSRLGALGYNVLAPVERMKPEAMFQLFCKLRQHHRLRVVPADSRESLREMGEALKRNEIVVFLVDRYVLGASAEVPFFDEPAKLPTGPYALALRSGAPVLFAYAQRLGPGRSKGGFLPLTVSNGAESEAAERPSGGASASITTGTVTGSTGTATRSRSAEDVQRMMAAFGARLEGVIAADPEQWVASLSSIWDVT